MAEESGEKSQEPTQHRRQKAREEGHVARSQDLGSAALLVVGVLALMLSGEGLVDFLGNYARSHLGGGAWLAADPSLAISQWNAAAWGMARHTLPVLGTLLLGAVVASLAQVGFLFLPQKVAFDLSRLDPLQGIQRLVSLTNVARLGFGIFKVALVAVVALVALYQERNTILGLAALEVPEIAAYLVRILLWTALKIGIALLLLAILDYGFQWWKHEQDLKMTPQEVREEMRNLEGDPQILARRRAAQRQMVVNRLAKSVPKADVVVTNPTELAVAIQYEPESMAAPIVVAKGAGVLAQRIRRLALEHGIPIVEKKPLAQALYKEVEINHPIPRDKYAAVAEILAYVYQLKGKKMPA
jgi:flagellar biosynthetic protein FlhB